MAEQELPPSFVRNVIGAHANGRQWLNNLPGLLASVACKWHLTLAGQPFSLSYAYVLPVVQNGVPAVLKLAVPGDSFAHELRALQSFQGHGVVRVISADASDGALLLARIMPGTTLATLRQPVQETEIAATIARNLWQASYPDGAFPTLDKWTGGLARLRTRFAGGTGPLDGSLVDAAEGMREELLQESRAAQHRCCLLHGDLHHFNILSDVEGGWLAIDPKGVVGDPCYDLATFLLNPEPAVFLNRSLQHARVTHLAAALKMDAQLILRWAFVHAVLAAWWTIEDGGTDWESTMASARVLRSLLAPIS